MKEFTQKTIVLCWFSLLVESFSSAIENSTLIFYEMSKLVEAIIAFANSLHQLHNIAFELLIHLAI
jgi:hypothetical protein